MTHPSFFTPPPPPRGPTHPHLFHSSSLSLLPHQLSFSILSSITIKLRLHLRCPPHPPSPPSIFNPPYNISVYELYYYIYFTSPYSFHYFHFCFIRTSSQFFFFNCVIYTFYTESTPQVTHALLIFYSYPFFTYSLHYQQQQQQNRREETCA